MQLHASLGRLEKDFLQHAHFPPGGTAHPPLAVLLHANMRANMLPGDLVVAFRHYAHGIDGQAKGNGEAAIHPDFIGAFQLGVFAVSEFVDVV